VDDILGFQHQEQLAQKVTSASLELAGLTRRFGEQAAVDNVSLSVNSGELVALVGASGSGKTTTLRMAAGYETPDSGRVMLDGRDITGVPPQKRGFGMVFQHYALFPHMSVQDNVAFGLEARGVARGERRRRAIAALDTVGLAHVAQRPVQSLSGGEQQRVALARAVVIEPRVLLLDEPLSNLDPTLRRSMRDELRSMLRKLNVTALLVTHDQEDAFAVADRVALMKSGRLLQVGRPEELYQRPADRDVAGFIGKAVLVPARLDGDVVAITMGGTTLTTRWVRAEGATEHAEAPPNPASARGAEWLAVLRPESLEIVDSASASASAGTNTSTNPGWPGRVESRRFAGAVFIYRIAMGESVIVEATSPHGVADEGEEVHVLLSPNPVAVVPA
jgi:ABC-type Fe3+/spermidine/putrescine transport system ATPase subunit